MLVHTDVYTGISHGRMFHCAEVVCYTFTLPTHLVSPEPQ